MGLLNKFTQQGSPLTGLNGATPATPDFAISKLHYEYSLNGNPTLDGVPQPSTLDLDGVTPSKYSENLPG